MLKKKSDEAPVKDINLELSTISKKLGISERIEIMGKQVFVTVKDHKDNFPTTIRFRQINPAKSNLGLVSKPVFGENLQQNKVLYQTEPVEEHPSSCRLVLQLTRQAISFFPSL